MAIASPGYGGRAPSGVQGHSFAPMELEAFQLCGAHRRAKIWPILRDFSVFFKVVQWME